MTALSSVIGYGVAASRPAAGTPGRLYYASDTSALSRDNGSTWDTLTPGGGSALTVEEVDGSPTDSAVTKLVLPNGTLGIAGHVATYTPAAATGGAMELIHEEVFGSDAASYTFSAIPGTYRHLLLEVVGRCGQAAVSRDLCLRPNNDSGANYEREVNYNSSASAMASGLDTGLTQFFGVPLMGTTGAASYPGAGRFLIRDYARTNFYKAIEALWTYREASWVATGMSNGYWKSTAAITSLVCLMNGGSNILTGSMLSLYGIH